MFYYKDGVIVAKAFECFENNLVHGFSTKDRDIPQEAIKWNLKLVDQVHSAEVVILNEEDYDTSSIKADALITSIPNILIGVKTADCVPILLYDHCNKIVGAIHAGWKGAVSGIIENTLDALLKCISQRKSNDIYAIIGPSIRKENYEVGYEFYESVINKSNELFDSKLFFTKSIHRDKFLFDLPGYCKSKLLNLLAKDNVYDLEIDTYSNPEEFFSYRHLKDNFNKSKTQLSVIGLK